MKLKEIFNYTEEEIKNLIETDLNKASIVLTFLGLITFCKYDIYIQDAIEGYEKLEEELNSYYQNDNISLLIKLENKNFMEDIKSCILNRKNDNTLYIEFKKCYKNLDNDKESFGLILDKINENYLIDKESFLINSIDGYLKRRR